jgi:hypothetical protein
MTEPKKRAPGGGRKKGEPTKLKRVPVALESAIDGLIEVYKHYSDSDFDNGLYSAILDCSERISASTGVPPSVLTAFQLLHRESSAHGRKLRLAFESCNSGLSFKYSLQDAISKDATSKTK